MEQLYGLKYNTLLQSRRAFHRRAALYTAGQMYYGCTNLSPFVMHVEVALHHYALEAL